MTDAVFVAASIYTRIQVKAMIETPKYVAHDAWQDRYDGRESKDEIRKRIRASPSDETNLTEFTIEACKCVVRGEGSFTLFGKLIGYPEHALCRYEIQLSRHNNLKWFPPPVIGPRTLHKHVYNERAIREDWTWDKSAELLKLKKQPKRNLTLQQAIDRLTPIFLDEANIEVRDPDVRSLFFRDGT